MPGPIPPAPLQQSAVGAEAPRAADPSAPAAPVLLRGGLRSVAASALVTLLKSIFRVGRRLDNKILRRARFDALAAVSEYAFVDNGPETFVVLTADRMISRAVYVHGDFEFEKVPKAVGLLGKDFELDLLVDVGANIGTICIPAVKRGIAKRAIAFEPEPRNYRVLVSNVHLNDLGGRITHHNVALGPQDDQVLEFELAKDNSGDHRIHVSATDGMYAEAGRKIIQVRSARLDGLLTNSDPRSCLVWMDTQGYEGHILLGAEKIIAAHIPMVLEFWPYGMKRANSYEALRRAVLRYPWFYDLSEITPRPQSTGNIDDLYRRLGEAGAQTDILLVSRPA